MSESVAHSTPIEAPLETLPRQGDDPGRRAPRRGLRRDRVPCRQRSPGRGAGDTRGRDGTRARAELLDQPVRACAVEGTHGPDRMHDPVRPRGLLLVDPVRSRPKRCTSRRCGPCSARRGTSTTVRPRSWSGSCAARPTARSSCCPRNRRPSCRSCRRSASRSSSSTRRCPSTSASPPSRRHTGQARERPPTIFSRSATGASRSSRGGRAGWRARSGSTAIRRRSRARACWLLRALVIRGSFEIADGYRAANQLLALDEPPTAIFASNDNMAIGALRAAAERGVRVPRGPLRRRVRRLGAWPASSHPRSPRSGSRSRRWGAWPSACCPG